MLILSCTEIEAESNITFLVGYPAKTTGWKAEPLVGKFGEESWGLVLSDTSENVTLAAILEAVARLLTKWRDPNQVEVEFYNALFRNGGSINLQLRLSPADEISYSEQKYLKLLGASGIGMYIINKGSWKKEDRPLGVMTNRDWQWKLLLFTIHSRVVLGSAFVHEVALRLIATKGFLPRLTVSLALQQPVSKRRLAKGAPAE